MYDYRRTNPIKKVVIPDSVIIIDDYTFYG